MAGPGGVLVLMDRVRGRRGDLRCVVGCRPGRSRRRRRLTWKKLGRHKASCLIRFELINLIPLSETPLLLRHTLLMPLEWSGNGTLFSRSLP